MSRPSDYTQPYPDAVEIIECSQSEFQERFTGQDICFLMQEAGERNDRWYLPGDRDVVETREETMVWDLDMLAYKDYSWNKRFHILPPAGVQPAEGDLPPGILLFRALSANARPAANPNKVMADRIKAHMDWAKASINQNNPKFRIAIEVIAGYSRMFFTAEEYSAIRGMLAAAESRYNAVLNAPLNPFAAGVRELVQSQIGTADQPPF